MVCFLCPGEASLGFVAGLISSVGNFHHQSVTERVPVGGGKRERENKIKSNEDHR